MSVMSVGFRKISEDRVDATRVTLRLIEGPDGTVLGRVSTLAYSAGTYGGGAIDVMSTEGADPPIGTALSLAKELAAFKEQDVDVVDPGGLWREEWGRLEVARNPDSL